MNKRVFFLSLLVFPGFCVAEVYKCEVAGQISFSDEPCGASSERINVDAPPRSGMRLDQGTKIETYQPQKRKQSAKQPDRCPYINSSELNTLIIREQVKTGMKPNDVRKSWGAPTSVRKSSGSTQWSYHWPNGNSNYVYFKNGCVSDFSSYVRNY